MKLTYLDTRNNAVFTRFDDCENARELLIKEKAKELHIHTNITGVAFLFSKELINSPEPKKRGKLLDLSFIDGLSQLESIYIYPSNDIRIKGFSSLYFLENLRNLELQFFTDWSSLTEEALDLSKLKKLKFFTSVWNDRIINLSTCKSLENLQTRHYPNLNCQELEQLINLKHLQIMESKITNLNGIEKLENLDSLIIGHCRKLENIDNISDCSRLEMVHIEKCPKLLNINISSTSLKTIILDKVENLNFLYNCPNVKKLAFNDLKDGNMEPILNNKISEVFFYPSKRKHYQYSEKELHQLLKEK